MISVNVTYISHSCYFIKLIDQSRQKYWWKFPFNWHSNYFIKFKKCHENCPIIKFEEEEEQKYKGNINMNNVDIWNLKFEIWSVRNVFRPLICLSNYKFMCVFYCWFRWYIPVWGSISSSYSLTISSQIHFKRTVIIVHTFVIKWKIEECCGFFYMSMAAVV